MSQTPPAITCIEARDLADATLVALAESRSLRQVFTLDRADFATYRRHGRGRFELVP